MRASRIILCAALLAFAGHVAVGDAPSSTVASSNPSTTKTEPKSEKMEGRYAGKWVTTRYKKLDGTTNCEVKQLADDRWQGRFWGEWQRVPFDYTVEFGKRKIKQNEAELPRGSERKENQPIDNSDGVTVGGKATIDGADYDWTGTLSGSAFKIKFTGSRYDGSLELAREPKKKAEAAVATKTKPVEAQPEKTRR